MSQLNQSETSRLPHQIKNYVSTIVNNVFWLFRNFTPSSTMFSRRYLQKTGVTIVVLTLCVTVIADFESAEFSTNTPQYELDSSGNYFERSATDADPTEAYNGTQINATPTLSTPSAQSSAMSGSASPTGQSTVTVTPASSMPSTFITATKVDLEHRILPTAISNNTKEKASAVDESTTDAPSIENASMEDVFFPSKDTVGQNRQGRNQKLHEDEEKRDAREEQGSEPALTSSGSDAQDSSTEYLKELLEADGGDSMGDFNEDNEIPEQLPAPMALINPNGEGNNPPLEDDFAEAFKKVNPSGGKRKRLRGGRRGRGKHKKANPTATATAPAPATATAASRQDYSFSLNHERHEPLDNTVGASEDLYYDSSKVEQTTPKVKRYRSTTPASVSAETSGEYSTHPVVKNGPKPLILQHIGPTDSYGVTSTLTPQLEKPGSGGHTEKISTYFFSTPAPSSRLRLRQRVKESYPSTTTTVSTTTTTQSPVSIRHSSHNGDRWKSEFKENNKNGFFTRTKFKIPEFVPINIGLEKDDRQESLENLRKRPSTNSLENKAYSLSHQHLESSTNGKEDSYLGSPTTPKSHKVRRPSAFSGHRDYDMNSQPSEGEKTIDADYYSPGAQNEHSTAYSSQQSSSSSGSHYDRTKDRVIFYKDSPFSAQHGPPANLGDVIPLPDPTPGGGSQTVGTRLTVSDGPSIFDNVLHPPPSHGSPLDSDHGGIFTRGQVHSADVGSHLESGFINGPPDASHIHSPNMIENQPHSLDAPHDSNSIHHSFPGGPINPSGFSQTYIEQSNPPLNTPIDTVYGTVEEVPVGGNPYDVSSSHHGYPPTSPLTYPFGSQLPTSPTHSPSHMAFSPHNSFPMTQYHDQYDHHHNPHQSPLSHEPHPHPPPPPPLQESHHHHQDEQDSQDIHNHHQSFAPTYPMHSSENDNHQTSPFHISNDVGSPVESIHGSHPSLASPPESEPLQSPVSSDVILTSSDPHSHGGPDAHLSGSQGDSFASHAHTMAVQADYEPANPPLPHDHPFHKSFMSFPAPGAISVPLSEHDQGHESNSIAFGPPFPPSMGDKGKPAFEPSPLIPSNLPKLQESPIPPILTGPSGNDNIQHSMPGSEHGYGGSAVDGSFHHSPSDPSIITGPDHAGFSGPVPEMYPGTYHLPPSSLSENGDPHAGPGGNPPMLPNIHLQDHPLPVDLNNHNNLGSGADKPQQGGLFGKDSQKDPQRPHGAFSNTPYVLMFPQLIPEEAMRPSPPSLLSKEIPVIQATSMTDFTSGIGSGEKPPLGPGFQAVPVHPRHQMYQVLAKTHYDKMMEKYMESKKRPPSAIYTPYGILVPVGTNVDASSSINHNVFAKPRPLLPKFRGEKSLLNALLGSASTSPRFHPPNGLGLGGMNRLNKLLEYEPAIDLLAEKLAIKIVTAQRMLDQQKHGFENQGSFSELNPVVVDKSDGKLVEKAVRKSSTSNSNSNKDEKDQMLSESKLQSAVASAELKDYLKGVLKGQLQEMVETSVSAEDRRPATLSSKLLNSFFRKSRLNLPQTKNILPMMPSASMLMPNQVAPPNPPTGMQNNAHLHSGIGHPFPPPLPQTPGGLLGTIRRLFNFGPPEHDRYDTGVGQGFAQRTLYVGNSTHAMPYMDGPSPRSSHFSENMQAQSSNAVQQYSNGAPNMLTQPQYMTPMQFPSSYNIHSSINNSTNVKPVMVSNIDKSKSSNTHINSHITSIKHSSNILSNNNTVLMGKPSKRKKNKPGRKSSGAEESKWSDNRLISSASSSSAHVPQKMINTSTVRPFIASNRAGASSVHNSTMGSKHVTNNRKTGNLNAVPSSDKLSSKGPKPVDFSVDPKKPESPIKRVGNIVSISSANGNNNQQEQQQQSNKPAKLDMFQTLLGSTRSVLNFLTKSEGRKAGGGLTLLNPRSV